MNYNYFVVGKCFNDGTGEAEIITAAEAAKRNYINGLQENHKTYDLYVDGFDTLEEAKEFAKDY